jgi:crotonobetainyl-CoA:carnitine CoA-transferase CaiB-like acyl-CoA transferase
LKGQFCGKLLRDLGVEVVKVEPPGGDPVRRLGPFAHDRPHLEGSLRFAALNAGKLSLTLDLAAPQGRDLLLRLVERADALIESYEPGELERLGLGEAALRERNPRLVVTSVSGFGQSGPYRDYLAPDIVGLAMGGLMYVSGDPALPPVKAPETQAYYYASICAALGTLLSLWRREASGLGHRMDISVQETIASQESLIRLFAFDGHVVRRYGSQHAQVAPASIFPASDGYVYLFVTRAHWPLLLDVWPDHAPELDDPKWLSNEARRQAAEWINEHVAQFTRRYTRDELVRLLQEKGVPCLGVNAPSEFAREEQIEARGLFQPTSHSLLGDYLQATFPLVAEGERAPVAAPPLLGQHTRELLIERLGLSPQDVELLFAQGII